jgi:murein DD-endopeptidase MepM/ murein hydrolase activator NlpD
MVIIETRYENLTAGQIEALQVPEGFSLYHLYAHLEAPPLVELDQNIACGTTLGYAGKSGYNVPVPHLHLEVRFGPPGETFASMAFYDTQATSEQQEAYQRWRTSGLYQHCDPMLLFPLPQE